MIKNKTALFISIPVILLLTGIFASCPSADGPFLLPWNIPPERTISKNEIADPLNINDHFRQVRVAAEFRGDQDPRIVLNYRMNIDGIPDDQGPLFIDYVVIGTARMVKEGSVETGYRFLLDISEVDYLLNNRNIYLVPLQRQGVRVLLQVTNGGRAGGGFSFANLPRLQRYQFATICASVVHQFSLDGLEFIDADADFIDSVNAALNLYAYPRLTGRESHYDWFFDSLPGQNPRRHGDRFNIELVDIPRNLKFDMTATPVNMEELWEDLTPEDRQYYFWMSGGYSYGNFLTYFRPIEVWQDPDQPLTAVIGDFDTHPLFVRETGFASGRSDLRRVMSPDLFFYHRNRVNFMPLWVHDPFRWHMQFTSIVEFVNYFINVASAPVLGWQHEGNMCYAIVEGADGNWDFDFTQRLFCHPDNHGGGDCIGSGASINDFVSNAIHAPGIMDLGALSDDQITRFSMRFASGDHGNPGVETPGNPFGLFYISGLGDTATTAGREEIARRLSLVSRMIYSGAERDSAGRFIRLKEDGPEVLYIPRN